MTLIAALHDLLLHLPENRVTINRERTLTMPNHATRPATDKRRIYHRDLGDAVRLDADVSPCVFMYPGYPLQISVSLHRHPGESLGKAFAVDRTKNADTYTPADVERLLTGIRIVPCPKCSAPAFDPQVVETNRGGLCEGCFVAELEARWAAAEEAEWQQIAARDRQMKIDGMVVRVTAWVHPQEGGDDYQLDWYLAAPPTRKQVREFLRKRGSCCLDDYQVITL